MNTLGRVHTDLQKQTWSTLFQIKWICKQLKQPKQKHPSLTPRKLQQPGLCAGTKWILTRLFFFLWHRQHHHPCNHTLPTRQLAAMKQFAVWQGRTCMFHTMFFISYKTSGIVQGECQTWWGAFCTLVLSQPIKMQHKKTVRLCLGTVVLWAKWECQHANMLSMTILKCRYLVSIMFAIHITLVCVLACYQSIPHSPK